MMSEMSQKQAFLTAEGDQYYQRNRDKLTSIDQKAAKDRVLASIRALNLQPRCILEVGCSSGWRLEALRSAYSAMCYGIDPSAEGIKEGKVLFPEISLEQGTTDSLPFNEAMFDLVIFGFCLYLCDRKDLFKIAYEADRVLKDKGYIAILDFHPTFPYHNEYKHLPGMSSYKMNYANLFSWNPAYTVASQLIFNHEKIADISVPDERVSVSFLYKNAQYAYPENPFTAKINRPNEQLAT
jgi:ubiquinone/menaquinone biosynthesis C-methylase UbiE